MIDKDYVNECIEYEENTGICKWKERPIDHFRRKQDCVTWNKRFSNTPCGSDHLGYLVVRIKGKKYKLHRIIWLIKTGSFPDDNIDHIDGNKKNNKWNNLRACNHQQNMRNKPKYFNNTSGYTGVWEKPNGNWQARVSLDSGIVSRVFEDKIDAVAWRLGMLQLDGYSPSHGLRSQ